MMDKTCRGFAEALAAREPVPGGGSASAFVGALGASLCGMVARYGATNPALADRADDLTHAFAQADELAQELVDLVAEDVRAYGQVSAAYGISREDPARPAAIQDALHVAAMPPYRIMDACGRALALLEDMADKGSRQLLSDVACGAVFCRAAMQGASLTLFANTTSMKDRARAEELEAACDDLLDTWLPRADALARRAADAARKRGVAMAELLKGAPVARALTEELAARCTALRERGVVPTLAIVRVGEREDDLSYERGALKRCEKVGIEARRLLLPANVSQDELLAAIKDINADPAVHGCLMFRPLPAGLDEDAVAAALDSAKDVDSMTPASLLTTLSGRGEGFAPCTAEAVLALLDHYGVELDGAKVAVVGRSLVIGRSVAAMLTARNATVTTCHTHTRDLASECRVADIVVAAVGRARTIGTDAVRGGQTIIDVGINWDEAAGKLVGDVDFDAAEPIVGAITPVPGGVGAVTTAILAKHVIEAAERASK